MKLLRVSKRLPSSLGYLKYHQRSFLPSFSACHSVTGVCHFFKRAKGLPRLRSSYSTTGAKHEGVSEIFRAGQKPSVKGELRITEFGIHFQRASGRSVLLDALLLRDSCK